MAFSLAGDVVLLPVLRFFNIFIIVSIVISSYSSMAEESIVPNDDVNLVYKLGAGDRLKVTIFNEPDLSGEFEVDGSGSMALPLVGNVSVGGISLRELEELLVNKYKDGYLLKPRIGVEILNFRPFFILGEVNKPGSYPYVSGLTVINAIALAGGYTHRAKTNTTIITRGNGDNKTELKANDDTMVLPGDSLFVAERFF